MVEHDDTIGLFLDKLDELGIADNTIVVYSKDNGAENFSWPDVIRPGTIHNEIHGGRDPFPPAILMR